MHFDKIDALIMNRLIKNNYCDCTDSFINKFICDIDVDTNSNLLPSMLLDINNLSDNESHIDIKVSWLLKSTTAIDYLKNKCDNGLCLHEFIALSESELNKLFENKKLELHKKHSNKTVGDFCGYLENLEEKILSLSFFYAIEDDVYNILLNMKNKIKSIDLPNVLFEQNNNFKKDYIQHLNNSKKYLSFPEITKITLEHNHDFDHEKDDDKLIKLTYDQLIKVYLELKKYSSKNVDKIELQFKEKIVDLTFQTKELGFIGIDNNDGKGVVIDMNKVQVLNDQIAKIKAERKVWRRFHNNLNTIVNHFENSTIKISFKNYISDNKTLDKKLYQQLLVGKNENIG